MNRNILYSIGLLIVILTISGCTDVGEITIPEKFFLAYARKDSSEIRVRYSEDSGATWVDGKFPTGIVDTSFRGVGAMADLSGVMHITMVDASTDIDFIWGLGPAIWDNHAFTKSTNTPASAPSGVCVRSTDLWLVTYAREDDTIDVLLYNHDDREFVGNYAPFHNWNSDVYGRPSITNLNGKFLLAWNSGGNLITCVGQMGEFGPSFSTPKKIPLPTSTEYKAGIDSDPDVTHDHNQFYVVFVREERGTLHGWTTFVYSSTDGENWQEHGTPSLIETINTKVNIAGHSDGTLITAAIRDNGKVSAAIYTGSGWSKLSDDKVKSMFGITGFLKASFKQFALIGSGYTEEEES